MSEAATEPRPRHRRPSQGRRGGPSRPPDILYHGCTVPLAARASEQGRLRVAGNRPVYLSSSEAHAWRVAHRNDQAPEVLYIDAGRARRAGVSFRRGRSGLWLADHIPARFVLNLQAGFAEQFSAGGIIVRHLESGPELLLVSCRRASGATWEIAKGKLEPGESPPVTAVREVREEMGIDAGLEITNILGVARYGFRTPEGWPRLKTLYVYLMRADPCPEDFEPAALEGIEDVRWFPLEEAIQRVTHGSLRPLMALLRRGLPAGS